MTAAVTTAERRREGSRAGRRRVPEWLRRAPWAWAPLAVAVINLLVLLAQLPRLIANLYLNADIASAPMIASLIGSAPSGRVDTLGEYAWYEPLWFMRLTHGLPAYRTIWEIAPVIFSLGALALVVWATWRAVGPWAATMTGAVLACIGTVLRYVYFTPDAHGASMVHGALLGAVLVWLVRHPQTKARLVAIGAPLAALTAAGETDLVLVAAGIVPFALAACIAWWRSRTEAAAHLAVFAVAVSCAAIIGGTLATHAMRADHIVHSPLLRLAFVDHIFSNVEVLLKGVAFLGSGFFFDAPPTVASVCAFVAGVLTLTAGCYTARLLWRWGRSLAVEPGPADPASAVREIHLIYWGLVGAAVVAAFMLTTQPFDQWSARYLVSAFVAVAVLLPALLPDRRRTRTRLAVAIAAFGVMALYEHFQEAPSTYDYGRITASEAHSVASIARSQHLRYGYTGFWQAAPITWESHGSLEAYPVDRCHTTRMCPAAVHAISTWYEPRSGVRTFLVQVSRSRRSVFPAAGTPAAVYYIDRLTTMFIYSYDIAAEMGHASVGGQCSSITPCESE